MEVVHKSLRDLLAEHPGPEGVVVPCTIFHDVEDERPEYDRVIVGTEKEVDGQLVDWSGSVKIDDPEVAAFKRELRDAWSAKNQIEVRILPPKEEPTEGVIPMCRVARASRPVEELVT